MINRGQVFHNYEGKKESSLTIWRAMQLINELIHY